MIGVIGDLHFKDNLSYADYVSDRRNAERKSVLDTIVESFKDCDSIVFLGDNFHSKNNSSEVVREFVSFVERFEDKEIFIIAGNHEKKGDGKTAIDFLGEIKKNNWHIFSRPSTFTVKGVKLDFLPYLLKSEIGVENDIDGASKIVSSLDGGDILFAHHAISGTVGANNLNTDTLPEIVLDKKSLENKYRLVVAGHIHTPGVYGKTVISGSVFTSEVGETEKFVFTINDDMTVSKVKLPVRKILKVENPSVDVLNKIDNSSIVKIVLTDKSISVESIKIASQRFDARIIVENYPDERKKIDVGDSAFDFSVENLLKMYAKEKNIDINELMSGYDIIRE